MTDSLGLLLIDNAPVGAYVVDSNWRICLVNRKAQPVFKQIENIIGMDYRDVIRTMWPGDSGDWIIDVFTKTLEDGVSYVRREFLRKRTETEEPVYFEWEVQRLELPDGQRCLVCYFSDISEHVQARKKLEELQVRFRLLFDSMPQLGWTARSDGYIDFYNKGWYEYTNTDFEQMKGSGWESVHDQDKIESIREAWNENIRARKPFEMTFRLRGADGVLRWFLTRVNPMFDADGEMVGWVGINADVNDQVLASELLERKVLERTSELQVSNEEMQRLANVISHETQAPMVAINSYMKLFAVRYKDRLGPDANDFIEKCLSANAKLQRLIDDLWNYASASRSYIEKSTTSLATCVEVAIEELQDNISAKNANVTVGPLPLIDGNKLLLTMLFKHVIDNAIRYSLRAPVIKITSTTIGDSLIISIQDNGIGIDSMHSTDIFKLYTSFGGKKDSMSTGMGLAICKKIVDVHNGRIWHEPSKNGTTFFIALGSESPAS